jgi:signal transduction histidine kinase
MLKPLPTKNEDLRIAELRSFNILDTEEDSTYDSLTKLASEICGTPICLISLVDQKRQWFKSHHGLAASETPREYAFCAHAIHEQDIFLVQDATKDERFLDNPLVTHDPKVVFYAGIPLRTKEGHALGTFCVIDHQPRQLTKLQLNALQVLADQVMVQFYLRRELESKILFEKIISKLSMHIPGMVYQYRLYPDGRSSFPLVSEAINTIYGVTPEQARNNANAIFKNIHPDDVKPLKKSVDESASQLTEWKQECRYLHPTKGLRWLKGNAKPEKLSDESVLWHGFITDITELKEQEHRLQYKAKMSSLGEMSAGLAHEINNPLAIIMGKIAYIEKILEKNNKEQIVAELKKIEATTDRIAKIVRGLKAFSRDAEPLPMQEVQLKTIFEDCLELCRERFAFHQIDLQIEWPDDSIVLWCKSIQISQVLINLLSNAIDAVLEPAVKEKWVKLIGKRENNKIVIAVIDSGHGISKDIQDKIMQPFFTTKNVGKGTGLGLSISHGLIEEHGGRIYLDTSSLYTKFVVEI